VREIIKTYRNYETGVTEEVKCIKPAQSITGHYKVELFNAKSGKKVEECEGENLITNSLNKYWTLFNYYMSHAKFQVPAYDGTGYFSLFGNMYLTSSASAESVSTNRVLGNTIGWAHRHATYAGTDIYRGTINIAESAFSSASSMKLVFDFPTHVSNGTFQSIFWTSANINTVTTQTPPLIGNILRMGSSNTTALSDTNCRTCVYNGDIYTTGASGIIYKTAKSISSNYGHDASITFKDISASDNDLQGIEWDGTNFWVFGDQNDKMYKLDTSGTVLTSWSITKATYFDTSVRFTCFGGKIYTFRRVDATTWNLYQFDTAGSLENTYNLYSAGRNITDGQITSGNCSFCNDGSSMFLISATSGVAAILEFDGSGNVLYDFESDFQNTASTSASSACFDLDTKLMHYWTTTTSILPNNFTGFEPIAQTLLPASITKTSTQTMKITYTFNFSFS
jgi:hypothetical protein